MKRNAAAVLFLAALCLFAIWSGALSETREAVIALEGMEETIHETLFESPLGFSFWYADEWLEAHPGGDEETGGVVVGTIYSDDGMVLSMLTEEEASEYAESVAGKPEGARVQMDLYRECENSMIRFCTLIAENGQILRAAGWYALEAAEGNAKFFDRVLDSVVFTAGR